MKIFMIRLSLVLVFSNSIGYGSPLVHRLELVHSFKNTSMVDLNPQMLDSDQPNVFCAYFFKEDKWYSTGAWFTVFEGKMSQLAMGLRDPQEKPGHALCSSHILPGSDYSVVRTAAYLADEVFTFNVGNCDLDTHGNVKIVSHRFDPVTPGLKLEVTGPLKRDGFTQGKLINYFPSADEAAAWVKDPSVAHQSCLEWVPGAIPLSE